MDIYTILSTKSHNVHYLKRYVKFIQQCNEKNSKITLNYSEKHHILPKAPDMFPEYSCFKENPWNKVILDVRQHYIAHLLLYKAYPDINSQKTTMLIYFLGFFVEDKNHLKVKLSSKMYQQLHNYHLSSVTARKPDGTYIRISKEEFEHSTHLVGSTKGMGMFKDKTDKRHHVSLNDPRIKSGELVGITAGYTLVMDPKNIGLGNFRVATSDPRYISGELVHANTGKRYKQKNTSNHKGKGTVLVFDTKNPEGKLTRIKSTDPKFISGEFMHFAKRKNYIKS